jgi:hypothetical protein
MSGPRRSLEMHQMSGSVDSALRLLDLADEGRFLLMSHVWRPDKGDESRERRGPGSDVDLQSFQGTADQGEANSY